MIITDCEKSIRGVTVAEFICGYVTAMLWSSTDESTPSGGEPFNRNYSAQDLTPEARERIEIECRAFLYQAGCWITEEQFLGTRTEATLAEYAGHDFWLTRVGHGAGYWDGDWAKHAGKVLSVHSKAFGEIHPYVTDDKQIGLE